MVLWGRGHVIEVLQIIETHFGVTYAIRLIFLGLSSLYCNLRFVLLVGWLVDRQFHGTSSEACSAREASCVKRATGVIHLMKQSERLMIIRYHLMHVLTAACLSI